MDTAIETVSAASAPTPVVPEAKVVVWFTFVKDEFRDSGRVIFKGFVDIRTEADLLGVEEFIKKNAKYDRVVITNWRSLEA